MSDLLTAIAVDRSVVRTWLAAIDNIKVHGVRKLIEDDSPTASDLALSKDDIENLDPDADREPWLVPGVRETFKAVVREQFVAKMNEMDPLTRVGAIAFEDDTDMADDWASLSAEALTSWAYTKGNNAVIKGGVKRGKTNFSLLLTERFLSLGWVVVANIRVKNPPKDLHYTPSLSAMLRVICQARLDGKKVLIILDEGGIFWVKIDTIMKQNKALAKMVLTYGKMDANMILISHFASDIPGIIARTAVADFEKMTVKNIFVAITDGIKVRPRMFTSLPPTKLVYDPQEIQMFEINIPIEEMFSFISKIPDGANQWVELLKWLDKHEHDYEEPAVDHKLMAQELKKLDNSVSEISKVLKEPRSTVGIWTKGLDGINED
jgi:hypothetical protein